ncbi:MAG TPA: hypothetical protein VK828_06225 [Terriglobales bacterium]|jgi:hypothetical protein|nr:hypothetical protein [Terriglobales bacterium]
MSKSRFLQSLAFTPMIALLLCGQQSLAQGAHHFQIRAVSPAHADTVYPPSPVEKKSLEQLAAGFGVLPPHDSNGYDEWPCFPDFSYPNSPDCSSIAPGGLVIGQLAYTHSLSACDANTSSAPNCGQIFWFYEDDTGDTTDDLVVSVVVKQGLHYILDTGPTSFGPNPFADSVIVILDDTAFGTLGQSGPGNGFCYGSTETCVNPVKGPATMTITTTVGISTIKTTVNMFLE